MLLCFGAAWPFSIVRSIRARSARGKSLVFLLVLVAGYGFGIVNKALYAPGDPVLYLYILNLTMVSADTVITLRNRRLDRLRAGQAA
jgi:hypothetical protein